MSEGAHKRMWSGVLDTVNKYVKQNEEERGQREKIKEVRIWKDRMETQSNLCFFPSSFIDTCASNTVSSCLWLTSFSTVSSAQAKLSSLSGSLCLSREHDRTELFFSFKRRNKAKRTTCTYNLSSLISICEDFLFTGP